MITPQQEDTLRIFHLKIHQQSEGLKRVIPPINVITQKEILLLRDASTCVDDAIPIVNNLQTSKNCPCTSPITFMGAFKCSTLLYSANSSIVL
jgi:hypothetical protein